MLCLHLSQQLLIRPAGGECTPSQAQAPSPPMLMPLLGDSSARPDTRVRSKTLSTMEHDLASAVLMLAQEREKKAKKGLLHSITAKVLTRLSTTLTTTAAMDKAQWATLINKTAALLLVTRGLKPWLQPLVAVALKAVASHVSSLDHFVLCSRMRCGELCCAY